MAKMESRYSRQEINAEIGKAGQKKLENSAITIVGLGALGSVAAELLARAGIGNLIIIDRDIVELSNLQRQSLYDENDIGKPKSVAAKEHLSKINSEIKIVSFSEDLSPENIEKMISTNISIVLDCTDNLETRFLLNDFCVKNDIPIIYSSAVGSKGSLFNIIHGKTACLRCFLKDSNQLDTCETTGVLNSITHIIPSLQTNEAIKIILGKEYEKNLVYFDVWKNEIEKIKVGKNPSCECCAKHNYEYLNDKKSSKVVKMCGSELFQIKGKQIDLLELKKKLSMGKLVEMENCLNFNNQITVFADGRCLIKAASESEAKSVYSKFIGN